MKVLVLCGGLGTRMRPLTDKLPKPMLSVNDRPLLHHLVELCKKNRLREIIFATHYLSQKIIDYFGDGEKFGVKIKYSHEDKPLGSAGAIKNAEKELTEDFMVLNGDTFNTMNLSKMIKYHQQKGGWGAIAVHPTTHPEDSDLVLYNRKHQVYFFGRDKKVVSKTNIGNAGVFIFKQAVVDFIPSNTFFSIEKDLIPTLLSEKKPIFAYYTEDYLKDIGTQERYKEVDTYVKSL